MNTEEIGKQVWDAITEEGVATSCVLGLTMETILWDMGVYAADVEIVSSMEIEGGYKLVLKGYAYQIEDLLDYWRRDEYLYEEGEVE